MLKKIFIGISAFVVLVIVAGFFFPAKNVMEKSIVINKPVSQVYPLVNNLQQWTKWSPWYKMEPTVKMTFSSDSAFGVGAWYSWKGEKTGEGKLTITESEVNKMVNTSLDFGSQGLAIAKFTFEDNGDQTKVIWGFESDNGLNPIARLFGALFLKDMLGKDYESGLKNMKETAERN